jgi:cysteine synthase
MSYPLSKAALIFRKNWNAHVKWTGPQILQQLPEINIICAGMGTSGESMQFALSLPN